MDKARFNAAVERHQTMVYRTALHALANSQDADDAVQEVFLRLYRRWLLRVTVNYCRDLMKSPWRRRVALEELPETPVFDKPREAALYREVMALPEKYRTVLNLFYYEELSVREIGDLLGLGSSTVTTRLARARKRLKERLGEDWQDE